MTCDSCGASWLGLDQRDVLDAGWAFHGGSGAKQFVMCGDCEAYYSLIWTLRAASDKRGDEAPPR
jgi:hypothetical protein